MKNLISIVLLWMALMPFATAQVSTGKGLSPDSLKTAVTKLIDYYKTYEKGNSDLLKREKFDQAFDELTHGSATSKDKNDAFRIVDAYIRADRDPGTDKVSKPQGSIDQAVKNTDQFKQAEKAIGKGVANLMTMPYAEFEATAMKLQPNASKREIKETYNKMHNTDGKKVAITAADDEMTPQQQMMWAVKTIENPKNFDEFLKAAKILDPKTSEAKLRQKWEKAKIK
jgi:hypothetical protein